VVNRFNRLNAKPVHNLNVVDFIKARRLVKGQLEYLIKWKGFDDDKYDTWEGLANLSGLEPDLATFEAQQ